MPKKLSQLSIRDALTVVLPILLLVAAAFYLAAQFIKPAPPTTLTLAAGDDGDAYRVFALRYREFLAQYGIDLVIEPSAGSSDNLARLRNDDSGIDMGLFQIGSAPATTDDTLVSLGELYDEPLWIFHRAGLAPEGQVLDRLGQLRGRRIAIGERGSGTHVLARRLLEDSGVTPKNSRQIESNELQLAAQLQQGRLDAVMVVGARESALVWTLLHTPGVRLMSLTHAEAYTRRFPFLSHLTLPRGAIDIAREIPSRDVSLVAPRATLLARADTHPALLGLMMQAISAVHGGNGLFQRAGDFPRAGNQAGEFPLADEAQRYYSSGKPWLQRFLPFWAATLVDRMIVMLVPLLAVLIPLARVAPTLYGWRIKSRIYRSYGELKFLEAEYFERPDKHTPHEWLQRLDAIEAAVNRLRAPLAFSDMLYTLRAHIALVREALDKQLSAPAPAPEPIT